MHIHSIIITEYKTSNKMVVSISIDVCNMVISNIVIHIYYSKGMYVQHDDKQHGDMLILQQEQVCVT